MAEPKVRLPAADLPGDSVDRLEDERPTKCSDAGRNDTNGSKPEASGGRLSDPELRVILGQMAPPRAADEIGWLGGYRVTAIVGSGGMGVVFRGEDPQLRRPVAIKVLKPSFVVEPECQKRFLREARAVAALKHPRILTVYQVGEEGGAPYLAMEWLEGESLDARLTRDTRLPLAEVLRLGRDITEGLAAAHSRGIIHRDLKPANIWLEADPGDPAALPRAKLLDFGLVHMMDEDSRLTMAGAVLGTPAYMAPEQAEGQAVDARTDLFSLGCVLYEMVTGRMAFNGKSTYGTLVAVARHTPASPSRLNPDVPPALDGLIMRLLAKKAAKRPASAMQVGQTLQAIEQSLAATQHALARKQTQVAASEAGLSAPWQERDRWLPRAGLLVAGMVALALLGMWAQRFRGKEKAPTQEEPLAKSIAIAQPDDQPLTTGKKESPNQPAARTIENPPRPPRVRESSVETTSKSAETSVSKKSKPSTSPTPSAADIEKPPLYAPKLESPTAPQRPAANSETPALAKPEPATTRIESAALAKVTPLDADHDRRAAQWVLSVGGSATVQAADGSHSARRIQDLPDQPFRLLDVDLARNRSLTAEGLNHLAASKRLQRLSLAESNVDDASLQQLVGLEALTELDITGTTVTRAAINAVTKAAPGCRVLGPGPKAYIPLKPFKKSP